MNHKLLLIDADDDFAQQVRQACAKERLDLVVARSGSEGIDLAWSDLPSAIVLSVELPDTNGFILCSSFKKNRKLKSIPLVLASNKVEPITFRRHSTLKGHADQYFQKSSPATDLINVTLPLLRVPRDQWLSSIANIPAEKPTLTRSIPSGVVWGAVAVLIAITIYWLTH